MILRQAILRERLQAHEGDRAPGSDHAATIARASDYRKGLSFSRSGPVATAEKKASAPLTIGGRSRYTIRPGACGAAHLGDKQMRSDPGLIRSKAFAAAIALLSLLPLASCEIPPSGVPTAADIRGVRPSGTVTMTQFFVSGTGLGSGTLTFRGRTYPFTLIGSLNGLGAIATTRPRARSISSAMSRSSRAHGFRATAISPSRRSRTANSGFRTTTASSCA